MQIRIPYILDTDVLIFGATTGAVEAALAVRAQGLRAAVVTAWTYAGEDVCATQQFWLAAGQTAETPLSQALFGAHLAAGTSPTPMDVKHTLEQALVEAEVPYLYTSYPAYLLRDAAGELAGAVVANRSGLQAIRARVLVDATDRALAARMSRAAFRPWTPGAYAVRKRVIGPDIATYADAANSSAAAASVRALPAGVIIANDPRTAVEHSLTVQLDDFGPSSHALLHAEAAIASWHPKQLVAADRVDLQATDRLVGAAHQAAWTGPAGVALEALHAAPDALYVLGGLADVSDTVAAALRQPCALMALGQRLGEHVATLAASLPAAGPLAEVQVDYRDLATVQDLDVCRQDRYFRYLEAPGIDLDLNRIPVLGSFDVVVSGGGTAGAPAGISAARAGAKTVIVEYLAGLGGVGTEGRICSYYHGNRVGFTAEIGRGIFALAPDAPFPADSRRWDAEWKKQWYLRAALEAGAEVWIGCLNVAAAVCRDARDRVGGVVVATPTGFGLLRAKAVVDSTGNADVAAAAGARTVNISKAHVAVQGTGLSPYNPNEQGHNTDYTFVDDTDVMDITRAFTVARHKFAHAYDLAQIVDSRQRQQVEGDFSLDPLDFLAGRTFPDTITTASSNFDSHGFTIHPVFMAKAPDKEEIRAHVPLRCLLPAGLDRIAVTGLGVSSHRDALPVIRMQADVQNQGYAAGRAAAMAATADLPIREIDVPALQRHLAEIGVLEPDVPGQTDSFPLAHSEIERAVETGLDEYLGLAVIFAHPKQSIPLLRAAHDSAHDPARRLRCAHLLGLLADPSGAATLIAHLSDAEWDEGWHFKAMHQFGFSLSPVDSMLVALGRTRQPAAVPVLLRMIRSLAPDREFSHFRAITLAFEALPSAEAAPEFARFLDHTAIGQNARGSLRENMQEIPADKIDTTQRNRELKELLLARGLYACGDYQGKAAAVLQAYKKDLHGHYARHARAILENAPVDGEQG